MAESQLLCMDESPAVFEKIPESKARFYYSEPQRLALEKLLAEDEGARKAAVEGEQPAHEFLSAGELTWIRDTFRRYDSGKREGGGKEAASAHSETHSGPRSTYWPAVSDTEVPPLDLGWAEGARFKGATRVAVYTHPPKMSEPLLVKEAARKLIQESCKVLAIVMDLLTDLQVLKDLLDAASKRRVPVYIVLDAQGMPSFLNMCRQLEVSSVHLRNIRVRSLEGWGMTLTQGKIPGSLCNRYMLVDGEKVMFGTYSFTWSSSRLNRTMITVMTGQVVDFFDQDFRELYAVSDEVNLYKEFQIPKQSATLAARAAVNSKPPSIYSTTRFQVSLGDQANPRVPAHKYYNPKYALMLEGLQPKQEVSKKEEPDSRGDGNLVMQKFLQANDEEAEEVEDIITMPDPGTIDEDQGEGASKKSERFDAKKGRSSLKKKVFSRKFGKNKKADTVHETATVIEGIPEQPAPEDKQGSKEGKRSKKSCNVS